MLALLTLVMCSMPVSGSLNAHALYDRGPESVAEQSLTNTVYITNNSSTYNPFYDLYVENYTSNSSIVQIGSNFQSGFLTLYASNFFDTIRNAYVIVEMHSFPMENLIVNNTSEDDVFFVFQNVFGALKRRNCKIMFLTNVDQTLFSSDFFLRYVDIQVDLDILSVFIGNVFAQMSLQGRCDASDVESITLVLDEWFSQDWFLKYHLFAFLAGDFIHNEDNTFENIDAPTREERLRLLLSRFSMDVILYSGNDTFYSIMEGEYILPGEWSTPCYVMVAPSSSANSDLMDCFYAYGCYNANIPTTVFYVYSTHGYIADYFNYGMVSYWAGVTPYYELTTVGNIIRVFLTETYMQLAQFDNWWGWAYYNYLIQPTISASSPFLYWMTENNWMSSWYYIYRNHDNLNNYMDWWGDV